MKNLFYLLLIPLLFIQCNSDDDNNKEQAYFPAEIKIESMQFGNPVIKTAKLTYNQDNQIIQIDVSYIGEGTIVGNSYKQIQLFYIDNNKINEIRGTTFTNTESLTIFNYDESEILTNMQYQTDVVNETINIIYDS